VGKEMSFSMHALPHSGDDDKLKRSGIVVEISEQISGHNIFGGANDRGTASA
jgi:hypothetical protein